MPVFPWLPAVRLLSHAYVRTAHIFWQFPQQSAEADAPHGAGAHGGADLRLPPSAEGNVGIAILLGPSGSGFPPLLLSPSPQQRC